MSLNFTKSGNVFIIIIQENFDCRRKKVLLYKTEWIGQGEEEAVP